MKKRIQLISGPRNISTALMYSFNNRGDTQVVDEPLYAYYLNKHKNVEHPGKTEILNTQSKDFSSVIKNVFYGPCNKDYLFIKNMAHHLNDSDWSFAQDFSNVFLIREPRQLIASFAEVIPNPNLLDIGLKLEFDIFNYLQLNNAQVTVVDSNDILKDPETSLRNLCSQLDIPFTSKMMKWPKGPISEDGVWAKYWYKNVHASTGFKKQKTSSRPFPKRLNALLKDAQKYYDLLYAHVIN